MSSRLLPLALVAGAALADARNLHELAFYLLVAAVPSAAIVALSDFGDLAELPGRAAGESGARVQAGLATLGLLGVVVAAAVRGQAPEAGTVPPIGVSALVACVIVFAAHGIATAVAPDRHRRTRDRSASRVSRHEPFAPPRTADPDVAALDRAA